MILGTNIVEIEIISTQKHHRITTKNTIYHTPIRNEQPALTDDGKREAPDDEPQSHQLLQPRYGEDEDKPRTSKQILKHHQSIPPTKASTTNHKRKIHQLPEHQIPMVHT